jgi:methyl-accepting chemotaxis protein
VNKTRDRLIAVTEEIQNLTEAALEGRLSARADASRFQYGFHEMVKGINDTLDAALNPVNEAATVLERIASKDLTARVRGEYRGDHAKIKDALNAAIDNLDDSLLQVSGGADQVSTASVEISGGSQSLSQSASEQASSLQEISASLQEISAMTSQNAANSKEARGLADGARLSADKGMRNMERLSAAIDQIRSSSDETAKIVKTIDEIAFQTNLLALNAAVEAARAGDAGKGFAVVAEEVRNLAIRSAEAAKNTSRMIEASLTRAQGGVLTNGEVRESLEEINDQANRVSEMIAEIAAASEQQRQGIRQVTEAMGEMDRLTQQNAAAAEEAASSAEELSSQAEEMRSMVSGFRLTGEGRAALSVRHHVSANLAPRSSPVAEGWRNGGENPARTSASFGARRSANGNGNGNGHHRGASADPRKVIPFAEDEDALQDF